MSEQTFSILSTIDVPSREPERAGKIDVMVSYRIGQFQTGIVKIPKETFTEETMLEAVKADIKSKAQFVGKTYTA